MTQPINRRRMLGWMGAGTALSVLPLGALNAQLGRTETITRNLRWDRNLGEALWTARGGPKWVVHDTFGMFWGGARAVLRYCGALDEPLTATERADIMATLTSSCAWFRSRGLWAPKLPVGSDDAFHIFYVDAPDGINGGTGLGAGIPVPGSSGHGAILDTVKVAGEVLVRSKEYLEKTPDDTERVVPEGVHMMLSGPVFRSYRMPPNNDHRWAPQITIAHELIHAIDQYAPGMAEWGEVKGWCGEGSTHAAAQFALRRIGYDPLKSYATGVRNLVKDIGLRPYDVTLALTEWPKRVPEFRATELREQGNKESDKAKEFWEQHATYLTCSFWRFLFQEEAPVRRVSAPALPQAQVAPYLAGQGARGPAPTAPGDFELFAAFRAFAMTGDDRARAAANSRWVDPVVALLDRFLKARHPVWGVAGLYRAFPAFIAHFVEWPDQIAKSRKGFLAYEKWLGGMFMDGVPLLEIAPGQDIIHEPETIPPYAARAAFQVAADRGDAGKHARHRIPEGDNHRHRSQWPAQCDRSYPPRHQGRGAGKCFFATDPVGCGAGAAVDEYRRARPVSGPHGWGIGPYHHQFITKPRNRPPAQGAGPHRAAGGRCLRPVQLSPHAGARRKRTHGDDSLLGFAADWPASTDFCRGARDRQHGDRDRAGRRSGGNDWRSDT
jgi:hypothetical protein